MEFFRVTSDDLEWITKVLKEENLCHEDLSSPGVSIWKAANEIPVGIFGLENHGEHAILRSVVVFSSERNLGYGSSLVNGAIEKAGSEGVKNLYLLTLTADRFFSRFGFEVIDRKSVPEVIASTHEFVSFCPDTAICMIKKIKT